MSSQFYVCEGSGDPSHGSESRRVRNEVARDEQEFGAMAGHRGSLAADLTGAPSPVACALDTLVNIESLVSVLVQINTALMRAQGSLVESGLGAVASSLGGALAASAGAPSGVPSESAPDGARAALTGRQYVAENAVAQR